MDNKKLIVGAVIVLAVLAIPIVASKMRGGATGDSKAPESAAGTLPVAATAPAGSAQAVGEEVTTALVRGNLAAVTARFDSNMKAALPESQLAATLQGLNAQVGAFKRQLGTRTEKVQGMDVVVVTCEFERAKVDVQVTVNASGQVAGLFFRPAA